MMFVPLGILLNGMNSGICFLKKKLNGVIFTSASSVRGFFEIMTKDYSESETLLELI